MQKLLKSKKCYQDKTKEYFFTSSLASLSSLEDQPRGHGEPVGSTHGPDPHGIDGGEQAESDDTGGDGEKVPQELEHAPGPVQVVLLWVGVPGKKRKNTLII